jgi:PAS domain S-box-containing protein
LIYYSGKLFLVFMNHPDKTKDQLAVELQKLLQEYNSLKGCCDNYIAASNRADAAMLEKEERYRAIYDQSPIAIELYDSAGALYHVNPSCLKLFGVENIEGIRGFLLFEDPNISGELKEKLNRGEHIRYQGPFDFEKIKERKLYLTTREGIIWLDVLITPLGASTGSINGYLVQIQDITDQKLAEEALKHSEEQFRNFYNEAPVGLYRTTPEGKILLANRVICEMLGFSNFEELSARNLEQNGFGPSYNRNDFIELIEKTGVVKDLEARWINSKGDDIIVLENAKATRDSKGNTLFYDGTVENITGQKRTEKALYETEKKYERMVTNIKDVVYSVDGVTSEFTYLSPAFETLLGYTEEDILKMGGRNLFLEQVLPAGKFAEHQDRFIQLHARCIDQAVTDELWWRCKDGTLKCIADHWTPVYQGGRLISTDGVLRDITAGKKAEEALNEALERAEASDRLKTAFMNNISHEVRTPLNGILGFAEVLDDPDLSPEDMASFKEILYSSSARLLNTINSYMDISLLVSGNMSFKNSLVNLTELLKQACANYFETAAAKGITMQMDDSGDPGVIFLNSDPELIRKVLNHLLENAIKFTESGSIRIGRQVLPGYIEVFIQDTGMGISKKIQDQIFDSFLQADVSYTRKHEGSGLGLAIVKGLIELLGGKIRVKSVEGSGSTFAFTIPYTPGRDGNPGQPLSS